MSFLTHYFSFLTPVFLGFPCGSAGKESAFNEGDLGSIPGLGRSPEEGKSYPLQYSCLENSMDCTVHGVAELDMTERLWLSLSRMLLRNLQCTEVAPNIKSAKAEKLCVRSFLPAPEMLGALLIFWVKDWTCNWIDCVVVSGAHWPWTSL